MHDPIPTSNAASERAAVFRPGRRVRLQVGTSDSLRIATGIALLGSLGSFGLVLLGLPGVDTHSFLHRQGIMDPLCGGTRSARFTMTGDWVQAWRYNPLGIFAVVGALMMSLRALLGAATGRWVNLTVTWTPRNRKLAITTVATLVVLLEVRQQFRADLLMSTF